MLRVLLSVEFRTDSATADPALLKERSVALRRRVSSRPTSIDSLPRIGDRSRAADHSSHAGFCVRTAVVLVVLRLTSNCVATSGRI